MGEYYPPFRILNLGIWTDPFELAAVKLLVVKESVMVSLDQIFLSVQLPQNLVSRTASGNGKISQDMLLAARCSSKQERW